MNSLRTIVRYWLWILVVAVLLQIAFAGYGAFDASDKAAAGSLDEQAYDDSFELHTGFAYLIMLGSLVAVVLALAARVGRRHVLHAVGIFILLIAQMILGWTGADAPGVLGALHPLNAVLILGAIASLALRLREEPVAVAEPSPIA
jgi:heme A synthase